MNDNQTWGVVEEIQGMRDEMQDVELGVTLAYLASPALGPSPREAIAAFRVSCTS